MGCQLFSGNVCGQVQASKRQCDLADSAASPPRRVRQHVIGLPRSAEGNRPGSVLINKSVKFSCLPRRCARFSNSLTFPGPGKPFSEFPNFSRNTGPVGTLCLGPTLVPAKFAYGKIAISSENALGRNSHFGAAYSRQFSLDSQVMYIKRTAYY